MSETDLRTGRSVALGAVAVIAISMVLPWQNTVFGESPLGIASGGWVTLVPALIAGWRLLRLSEATARHDALIATVMGFLATLGTVYLLIYFLTTYEGVIEEVRTADPAWGLFVALAASVTLMVASFSLWRTAER